MRYNSLMQSYTLFWNKEQLTPRHLAILNNLWTLNDAEMSVLDFNAKGWVTKEEFLNNSYTQDEHDINDFITYRGLYFRIQYIDKSLSLLDNPNMNYTVALHFRANKASKLYVCLASMWPNNTLDSTPRLPKLVLANTTNNNQIEEINND